MSHPSPPGSHQTALVPLSVWPLNAPDLIDSGKRVDIGTFCAALIYYDRVLVNITTRPEFAEFLRWFIERNSYNENLSLMRDGEVGFYDYAFSVSPVLNGGTYSLWNVQDELQAQPGTFEARVLSHPAVTAVFGNARQREKLYKACRGQVIEAHAGDFTDAVMNARSDLTDPVRAAHAVQARWMRCTRLDGWALRPTSWQQSGPIRTGANRSPSTLTSWSSRRLLVRASTSTSAFRLAELPHPIACCNLQAHCGLTSTCRGR